MMPFQTVTKQRSSNLVLTQNGINREAISIREQDQLGKMLEPGLKLDCDQLEKTRPVITEMLK